MVADSLSFTSALSVALAVVFLVITVGISIVKLISGGIEMPRLLPDVTDLTSALNLFTVVPVLVTAYICHYNGKQADYSFFFLLCMCVLKRREILRLSTAGVTLVSHTQPFVKWCWFDWTGIQCDLFSQIHDLELAFPFQVIRLFFVNENNECRFCLTGLALINLKNLMQGFDLQLSVLA